MRFRIPKLSSIVQRLSWSGLIGKGVLLLKQNALSRREIERRVGRLCFDDAVGAFLREQDIDVVLDVGANVGDFGVMIRNHKYSGKILSFEPVSEPRSLLEEKASLDTLWSVFPFAAGAEDSESVMTVTKSSLDFSSLLSPNDFFDERFEYAGQDNEQRKVTVRRLDTLLEDLFKTVPAPKIFLKTDTQGFDLNVISGLGGYLDLVAGLQIELSLKQIYEGAPDYHTVAKFLEDRGFAISSLCPISKTDLGEMIEVDSLFIRKSTSPSSAMDL
ncbi:MAG: FkbM family methyltransferase [Verrucomicrobiales bacterium]|nr:FkbM family methyltransferase [Verrucomicrobiales bacterium]